MSATKKQSELAKQLLTEYPTAGSLTLAKRLHLDFPEHFNTIEHARSTIRFYRGQHGKENRRTIQDLTHVKDLEKVLADRFALPEPAVMAREPYVMPKVNARGIVFGDAHFPYQKNDGLISAIEYGLKKDIQYIIMNGDMMDVYQDSRFVKDGRKPNLDYELDLFYQFLLDLRATFPKQLIIWKFGNHEERYDTYWKTAAPLHYSYATGLEDAVLTPELNITVVKDKRRIVVGDLNILHGHEYPGGSGQVNPARGMFLRARCNVLVNHFHRSSSHKGSTVNGDIIRTYSLGSMCAPQDYSPYGDQDCSFGYLHTVDGVTFVNNREVE